MDRETARRFQLKMMTENLGTIWWKGSWYSYRDIMAAATCQQLGLPGKVEQGNRK